MSMSDRYGLGFEKAVSRLDLRSTEVDVDYMRTQLKAEDSSHGWHSLIDRFALRSDREFVVSTFTAMVCESALGTEVEHAEQLRILANNVGFESDEIELAMESDQLIEAAYAQADDAARNNYNGFSEVACKMAIRAARGIWVARYALANGTS